MSYKNHFKRALEADPERIHLAAHSHHLWPDASFGGHMEAWSAAARLADRKWDAVFGELIPRAQAAVARVLRTKDPARVVFAPNTHDLYVRILSCFPAGKRLRVLTTDAEFHSFARQTARLEEDGELEVERVPAEPFATFGERFAAAARKGGWDLVYVSHVFFSSGYAVPDLAKIVEAVPSKDTFVVIDGYHAFCAIPIDLGKLQDRVFYVAGGYKYAMAGEGCCFMHVPPGYGERPRDTGWYAAFGALEDKQAPGKVPYAAGGARFYGATFDPTGIYRLVAVLSWLERLKVGAAEIHAHAVKLQEVFVKELSAERLAIHPEQLVVPLSEASRGQFLTFQTARAKEAHGKLLGANVVTDVRGDRLRFGFGLYQDEEDIVRAVGRMRGVLPA